MAPGTRFDVLVAGGGSAGCVLAARLSEDAGARRLPGRGGARLRPVRRRRAGRTTCSTPARSRSRTRGRPTARTARSCGRASRRAARRTTPASCSRARRRTTTSGGTAGATRAIEPYLRRAERAAAARGRSRADELSPWHARLRRGGAATPRSRTRSTRVGTVRWNAAFAYLDPARGAAEPHDPRRHARRPRAARGDRAVGLTDHGRRARAGTVVLAAGAYGSPAILLRSGIGPGSATTCLSARGSSTTSASASAGNRAGAAAEMDGVRARAPGVHGAGDGVAAARRRLLLPARSASPDWDVAASRSSR